MKLNSSELTSNETTKQLKLTNPTEESSKNSSNTIGIFALEVEISTSEETLNHSSCPSSIIQVKYYVSVSVI